MQVKLKKNNYHTIIQDQKQIKRPVYILSLLGTLLDKIYPFAMHSYEAMKVKSHYLLSSDPLFTLA